MDHLKDPFSAYVELLSSALEKISKCLNARKNKELRELCLSTIPLIKNDHSLDSNKYYPIFKSALDSKITKVLEVTLYHIQKLISHGFLTGNCEDTCNYTEPAQLLSQRHPRRMVDAIVESICKCVQESDDNVQLQVIKTLLTMITSFNCEIHDRTLLEAFRACYHIHITSKNLVNQTTAKATLTQMMHYVFQRMENNSILVSEEPVGLIIKSFVRGIVDDVVLYEGKPEGFPMRSVPMCLNPDDQMYQKLCVVKMSNDEGFSAGKFGWCVVCRKTAEFYCLESRDPVCSEGCKKNHLKAIEVAEKCLSGDDNDYLVDAVIIFRSICKLSLKELPTLMPSLTFKSKVLSLELILAVIDNPGPTFCTRKQFMDIIRTTLCESLLTNSISTEKTIFALSLSIFVSLVNNFKDSLKTEIGVFMEHIFIKILESDNSSYHQKLLVVEVFFRITQNPRTTLELFLNYDCDVEEKDIFARMIDILGKIAVGKQKLESNLQPQQESTLKLTALETFTSIVTTQVAWLDKQIAVNKTDLATEELEESTSDIGAEVLLLEFEKNKILKTSLVKAVTKFNVKPAIGLKYLQEAGHLDTNNPKEVAFFLKTTPGIDKTVLGEFFGAKKEPNLTIFHEFVQLFEFKQAHIVEAIRCFLASFRLPGEGQVIDRIMQMFAEKYYSDNPSMFEEADTVYVLSFAIIMLQTDLHKETIAKKMPLAQFLIMNSGINKGKDLDPAYLEDIYNTIKNNKFTLEEDELAKEKLDSIGKKKQQLYMKESEKMLQKGTQMIKEGKRSSVYYTAQHIDHLKTMLEALWHPLLATFSIVLEEATEPKFWRLSLQGLLSCIKIACRFSMSLELEIFISSLAKFTSLIYLHNQITDKNIQCMKALIEIAKFESNYLKGSWLHILKCLSKLDHLHLISSGVQFDGPVTENDLISSENISVQITPAEIDYIFYMSSGLDDDTIIEFVTRLIEVSQDELWGPHPRTFCLQALVNVADVNMNRMRYVWSRVWKALRDHFSKSGLHSNQFIACFAVDSLKQLAIKFLQKEEFEHFNFQKEFLQPFEVIIKNTHNGGLKELIVACMGTFVFTVGNKIRSGWGIILEVLSFAAREKSIAVIEQAFLAIKGICEKYLSSVFEHSQQICSCLLGFLEVQSETVCIECIEIMVKCGKEFLKIQGEHWKAMIEGISRMIKDARNAVRNSAVNAFFNALSQGSFSDGQLAFIYENHFIPIFQYFKAETYEKDWVNNTFNQSFISMSALINQKYTQLSPIIPSFLLLIQSAILTMQEYLSKVAILVLKGFITSTFTEFSKEIWEVISEIFNTLVNKCLPLELLETLSNGHLAFEPRPAADKILILHNLLISFKEILTCEIPEPQISVFISTFQSAYNFSRDFDSNLDQRKQLWTAGFMAGNKTLPGLFRIEKEALIIVIDLLSRQNKQENLYGIARNLISDVSYKENLIAERKEEISAMETILAKQMIPALAKEPEQAMKGIGESLIELLLVNDGTIREELKKLLQGSLRVFS